MYDDLIWEIMIGRGIKRTYSDAETDWNLKPFLQYCNACTGHIFLNNKIQGNCMGLKIAACMCSWCKFWTKDTKRLKKKIQYCHF